MSLRFPRFLSGKAVCAGRSLRSLMFLVGLTLAGSSACSSSDSSAPELCTSDAQCANGERCSPNGTCVAGAECAAIGECQAIDPKRVCNLDTLTCDLREGFADECDTGRPCPFGQFCSTLLGRCFESSASRDCTRRSQCPSGQTCDRTANKCIPDFGCFSDAFCEGEEICDLVNRTCRALSVECISCFGTGVCDTGLCTVETSECIVGNTEPVCETGEICDPLGRCVQCTRSDDCGPGLFCNVSVGRCESNVQCADDPNDCPQSPDVQCVTCELPEVCDPRTRRCQAPPTPCEDDTDCPAADEFCDTTLDPPVCARSLPECLDDRLDEPPNDSIATAAVLNATDGPVFEELKACPANQDWYRLDVEAGTFLTVDLRFEHRLGDLEMQLFLRDGRTLLDQSRTVTDNERVELEVGTDLTVYVRVFFGVPNAREVPYSLIVARDPGDLCLDDGNEPDDALAEAVPLANNIPYEGRVCPADPDWFVLRNVPAGSRVDLSLDVTHNLGDLDLEVYRLGGPEPIRAASSRTDDERLSFDASFGGDYYLRVFGKGADTNVYRLRATVAPGMGVPCLDDSAEPNDSPSTATSTASIPVLPQRATICGGDDDWYVIPLDRFEFVQVDLGHEAGVDLDIALYEPGTTDPNVTPVASSVGVLRRESLVYRTFEGGNYLLRVRGVTVDDISPYDLNVEIRPSFFNCVDDRFDVAGIGDTREQLATIDLPPFIDRDLTICAGDEDWYRLLVEGGQRNVVRVSYIGDLAPLEIEVFQLGNGTPVLRTEGLAAADFREFTVNAPGVGLGALDLRVYAPVGGASPYSVSIDLLPVFDCTTDPSEPNNNRFMAAQTVSSTAGATASDLLLCPTVRSLPDPNTGLTVGDEDWFVLRPPEEGARIEARIDFTQGDLLLELFSPNGGPRACLNSGEDRCFSDGNDLSELITFTATTTAPYFLRVSSVYSSESSPTQPSDADTDYTLSVEYTLP